MKDTRRRTWLAPISVNAILGIIGIAPFFLLWVFLAEFPLNALGLTGREPTNNDGILPWIILLIPVEGVFLAIWYLSNYLVRNGTRAKSLPSRRYWAVSGAVLVSPILVTATWATVNRL